MKYMQKFRKHFSDRPVFTSNDVLLFLSELGATKEYSYLLISNLLKKGEIKKLKKGFYTFHDDPTLSSFAFSPSYHGLQDALSLLDLWDQETNTVLITPRKMRMGRREILGSAVFVRRINRKMFFGYSAIKYFKFWIQVSDVEKTLIDFVYFHEPLQDEVLGEMKRRIDMKKLTIYLKRCSASLKKKVLTLIRQG
jgi:predicted transcriptional regulator of viral defense system